MKRHWTLCNYGVGPGVIAPVAAFAVDDTSPDLTQTVTFTNQSTGATSWDWDFGDGSAHATTQNPTHQYAKVGTFTVVLVATNAAGNDTETKADYITVTFTDTFTDTDTTLLTAHNAAWTAQTPDVFEILSNGIVGNGTLLNLATVDVGEADVEIEINLTYLSSSSHSVGIAGRWIDYDNGWYVLVSTAGNGFQIIERNGGVSTTRAFSNTLPVIGESYLLQITFNGTTISATFRSVTISYASATFNQTATKFGVYSRNSHELFDNVNNRVLDFFVGAA